MRTADILVYGRDRRLQLAIEAKAIPGMSGQWAQELRSNLLEFDSLPAAPYFLLALPDSFYLWGPTAADDADAPPQYRIDAREVLAPYTASLDRPLEKFSTPGFRLLVASWLQDLMLWDVPPYGVPAVLLDSGLYEAIRGGSAAIETAV